MSTLWFLLLAAVALEAQAFSLLGRAGKHRLGSNGLVLRRTRIAIRALRPSGTLTSAQGCTQYHEVENDDTCYGIAQSYGLSSWQQLRSWNNIDSSCSNLWTGYSYCVAGPTSSSSTQTTSKTTTKTTAPTSSVASVCRAQSASKSTSATSSAKPTSTASLSNITGAAKFIKGKATWYYTGMGACGGRNSDSDLVVAVSEKTYKSWPGATSNPNLNPICGTKVRVKTSTDTVTVTVVDLCPECDPDHLDLSPAAFKRLADPIDGLITVHWRFLV